MRKRFIAAVFFLFFSLTMAAGFGETLRPGMSGDDVKALQQALIDQKYLSGTADGVFGTRTEHAVREFQRKNGLIEDGLAGDKTQALLYGKSSGRKESTAQKESADSGSFFRGDYSTIREDSDSARITLLQKALISMDYLKSSADGKFGDRTKEAVTAFQRANGLTADGLAGKKTLKAMEKAMASGHKATKATAVTEEAETEKVTPPDKDSIQLLHWYNEVEPRLRYNQTLTVYDPSTKLSWNLVVSSMNRRCDCEPKTSLDTQRMMAAFNGKCTWNQKGVYVKLPDGRWTVAATCSMSQRKGSIKDNDFEGKVSVHFLRDLDECEKTDPDYGLSNQRTIRSLWKKVSGQTVN